MKPPRTITLPITIPLRKKLIEAAKKEGRTMAGFIRFHLERILKA